MKFHPALLISAVAGLSVIGVAVAQKPQSPERPAQFSQRGTHGAIAAGSDYATGAGMRMLMRAATPWTPESRASSPPPPPSIRTSVGAGRRQF